MADLIQAWRSIRRGKGYAAAALLTLALGLGANAAIFTVVLGVLVRPLPFRDPGRLVWVGHAHREEGVVAAFSTQDFDDLVKGSGGAFSSLAGLAGARLLGGILYGVGPADPATYGGVALLIAAAAFAASYLPAREAARVDPMVAIKE